MEINRCAYCALAKVLTSQRIELNMDIRQEQGAPVIKSETLTVREPKVIGYIRQCVSAKNLEEKGYKVELNMEDDDNCVTGKFTPSKKS